MEAGGFIVFSYALWIGMCYRSNFNPSPIGSNLSYANIPYSKGSYNVVIQYRKPLSIQKRLRNEVMLHRCKYAGSFVY